jgi:hypothetical protein
MRKTIFLALVVPLIAFKSRLSINGTWQFAGDISHGKREGAPKEYALQKKYKAGHYEAFLIEKGSKPEKFETGNYVLKGDTCIDTETFCSQPSKITHIPIHYLFTIKKDTLTIKGVLPNGVHVEEYWKKVD